jgi:hypothetical protein
MRSFTICSHFTPNNFEVINLMTKRWVRRAMDMDMQTEFWSGNLKVTLHWRQRRRWGAEKPGYDPRQVKGKLFLCFLTEHDVMKAYWGGGG